MNVEIWTEVAQFPEKEYRNEIFVAVHLFDLMKKKIIFLKMIDTK
jgi:hypothetical protein